MAAGIWFWIIFVVSVVCCGVISWPISGECRRCVGVSLVIMILIGLLGWGVFGPPIR